MDVERHHTSVSSVFGVGSMVVERHHTSVSSVFGVGSMVVERHLLSIPIFLDKRIYPLDATTQRKMVEYAFGHTKDNIYALHSCPYYFA